MEGYENFKSKIFKKTGLDLSLYKERQMKRRIESLIKRNNCDSFEAYFRLLDTDKAVFDEFINYLTINVSEFFRNTNQWEVLKTSVIPELLKTRSTLKVWSAACSTGEEPYTLVMTLSNFFPLNRIKILAVDIDKEAINKAKIGVYSAKSIENVPEEFKKKYFEPVGNAYKISEEIKKCVEFQHFNLLKDTYPKNYDLIVCRNVMIYFTEEAKDEMYKKFNDALVNDGILFVGSTEQIIVPAKYNFKPLKTFFYQKSLE
ncbi:MAG: protein-glutamate O-methyltransferase CheR [Clostridia bacterium]|nr:protein-glutamate O-methyltransferase CheR [Clostridia bacterium]